MTTPDHAELQRLAEAATPGPREHIRSTSYGVSNRTRRVGPMVTAANSQANGGGTMQFRGSPDTDDADAAYVAAASPDTVLALLAEIAALREALDDVLRAEDGFGTVIADLLGLEALNAARAALADGEPTDDR